MGLTNRTLSGTALCALLAGACGAPAGTGTDPGQGETEALVTSAAELGRTGLSADQERTVVQLIDNICGDTWCEGDHNFRFDRLECKQPCGKAQGACTLTFRMF